MDLIKLFCSVFLIISLSACGSDEEGNDPIIEPPEKAWDITLNGEDFNVSNIDLYAYFDSFTGDLIVGGTKSNTTGERIVLTFDVSDGPPFINGETLSLSESSGHTALHFNNKGNEYSSHHLDGEGTFDVEIFLETESRTYLSGNLNALLFNDSDSTSVTVSGYLSLATF